MADKLSRIVFFFTTVFLLGLPAQVSNASLSGSVADSSGAGVPETRVVARNTATNIEYATVSNGEGLYVIPSLPAGEYSLTAERTGFNREIVSNLRLAVDQRARVDFQLQVGSTSESVQVTGQVNQVDMDSSTVGQVIENKRVLDLPLNGRNFSQLAALTPGTLVQGDSQFTGQPSVLVNGNRSGATGFLIDGAENFEQNAQTVQVSPSIETIQEFKVQSSTFGADSGRQAAVVSVISKSGTNQFHGNLFEFLRNRAFDARNFFSVRSEPEDRKRNQFGGTLGGPIVRNRVFFFGGYEGIRQRLATVANSLVPTAAQRRGDLSTLPAIYDPATTDRTTTARERFAGNIIPGSRLSPQALGLLEFIPLPNAPGDRYVANQVGKLTNDQVNFKLDHRVTDKDSYFARFTRDERDQNIPGAFDLVGGDMQHVTNYNAIASYTRTFSPVMLNEFRVSTSRFDLNFDTATQGLAVIDRLGITGLDARKVEGIEGLPILNVTGYGNFGDIGIRPLTQFFTTFNYADTLTWIRGSHTLRVGADLRLYRRAAFNGINARGNYSFGGAMTQNPLSPGGTGSGLADFLLGLPASAGRNYPRLRQVVHWKNLSSFVQDDWKATRRLTLNIGLRHDFSGQPYEERNRIGSFDLVNGRPIAASDEGGTIDRDALLFFTQTELDYLGVTTGESLGFPARTLRNNKWNGFAPRFGFSLDVFGTNKTVLRGGYGIFYTLVGGNLSTQNIGSVPFFRGETFTSDQRFPTLTLANAFPGSGALPVPEIFAFQQDFANSYVQEWSFNIQHQLGRDTVVEIGYVGNKGTALDITYQANQPRTPGAGAIQARRPYPKFSTIAFNTTEGYSNYHALQAKAERRFHNGLTYLAAYTFSKAILMGGQDQNPNDLRDGKGLASYDVPHRFVLSSVYELPFGKGRAMLQRGGWVNAVAGGWQVGGILQVQSGFPFTPTTGRDIANIGTTTRPNRSAQGTVDNLTIDRWFDASAFTNPAAFTYGNSGVNILRGPGSQILDLVASKNFGLGSESRYLQFRAEAFNSLNHANFGLPNANINQPAQVGRIFSAGSPRVMQLALKLFF